MARTTSNGCVTTVAKAPAMVAEIMVLSVEEMGFVTAGVELEKEENPFGVSLFLSVLANKDALSKKSHAHQSVYSASRNKRENEDLSDS